MRSPSFIPEIFQEDFYKAQREFMNAAQTLYSTLGGDVAFAVHRAARNDMLDSARLVLSEARVKSDWDSVFRLPYDLLNGPARSGQSTARRFRTALACLKLFQGIRPYPPALVALIDLFLGTTPWTRTDRTRKRAQKILKDLRDHNFFLDLITGEVEYSAERDYIVFWSAALEILLKPGKESGDLMKIWLRGYKRGYELEQKQFQAYEYFGHSLMLGTGSGVPANRSKAQDYADKAMQALEIDAHYGHTLMKARLQAWKTHLGTLAAADGSPQPDGALDIERILEPLHRLKGLAPIKTHIREFVEQVRIRRLREEAGLKVAPMTLNFAFMGPPGTGKTTVARLMANILYDLGLIENNNLVEVDRGALVGEYIGQTAPLVRAKIKEARGGVLFIDEAYQLVAKDSARDFGHEALATLIKEMEDQRANLVVIFAGYSDRMKEFFAANPGLQSRIPHMWQFDDFDSGTLAGIFDQLCADQDYKLTDTARQDLERTFKKYNREDWSRMGYARAVRSFFERAVAKQARRLSMVGKPTKDQLMTLESADLEFGDDGKKTAAHLSVVRDGDE